MKKKALLLILALPFLGLTTKAGAADDLPTTQKFARYEAMLKRSPFAVATAGAPVGAAPDFARDLYVANAAHSVDGDYVTIASTTDKNLKEYLNTKDTVDGYTISNIQWSDRVGETKVTITKNGQFANSTFNEALLSQAIQNPVAPIVQATPRIPGRPEVNSRFNGANPPQIQRPMPVPQIPTPPPHVRPVIRRKIQPGQPATNQPTVEDEADLDPP